MAYRIAFATSDGEHIDRHFGAAEGFLILEEQQDGSYQELE